MSGRKNFINIDFSSFSEYAERLDELGADLHKVFGDAMEQAAETVECDTSDAIASSNLPASGKYSRGATQNSLIRNAKVTWSGEVAEIGLGFDKSVPGSGGWLITGTPKMSPDYALEDIYGRKKYERQIIKQIQDDLSEAIHELLGG